jgi:acetyl-CoA acetyltransferase
VAALDDAGLGRSDIDGLFNLAPMAQPIPLFAMSLAEYLGIHPVFQSSVDAGGTWSIMAMILNCVQAVQSGQCSVAVCTYGEPFATGRSAGGRGMTTTAGWPAYEAPFGIAGAVVAYALLASRHMAEFGTTEEALCAVAMSARRHAALNEGAFRRSLFSEAEYFDSRPISTPLRLFDCSTIVDGAGALVVTSKERADDLRQPAVQVLSHAGHMSHRDVGQFTSFDDLRVRESTQMALQAAGLSITDVDLAVVHDAFTISTLVFVEEMGLCPRGQGGPYAQSGGLDLGGSCPINTHGGLLSDGHLAGVRHAIEAVRQLRGMAGTRQVQGAEVALIAGGGGMFGGNAVMALGRDR